ncbi:hypothetical protein J2S43_004123 [Catenuloplanes nepalensis]|uniref:Uncharacterized protein n=1 Tax=Catenuloplanes nepalensis TaxID=587533 RepID=A0ABT9MVZ3_9ACTN|nr:hypothetical protein [Catenuloplanes nepalensis]MDP9795611.1 hypothetical protein [Catenuloplanes nepalensis]
MGFFDGLPPPPDAPDPVEPPRPAWMKPDGTLGVPVPLEFVLAYGTDVAVCVSEMVAYPNGIEFTVSGVLRAGDQRRRILHPAFQSHFPPGEAPGPDFLRVGVLFADGRIATNLTFGGPSRPGDEPAGPLMMRHSGHGDVRRADMTFWLWPLPPEGPLTVVFSWPAQGIDEFRAEMDGALIRAAADRAVVVWSDR